MTLGFECYNIMSDPIYMQESINYEVAKVEHEDSMRILMQFFHEGFRVCNEMLDVYSNEYMMYAEAGVGDFLKNLAEKVKAIIKKIFEWLKNVVKVIGKIILAPFGVIFRKSSSNNSGGGGGGGGGTSSSDNKSDNKSKENSPSDRTYGSAGSVMGILSGIAEDFDFKYIKDTGFNTIFNPVDIIDEIIKMAENKSLLDSLKDKSIVKQYTDAVVEAAGDVDKAAMISGLKTKYTDMSNEIMKGVKYFGSSIYKVNQTNRSKSNTFFDFVKDVLYKVGIGDERILPNSILNEILKSTDLKKELLVLSKYENQVIDYTSEINMDIGETTSNASMISTNIENKQKVLNELLTGNTAIKFKTQSILSSFIEAYKQMPEGSDTEKKYKADKIKAMTELRTKIDSATTDDVVISVLKSALEVMKTEITPLKTTKKVAMQRSAGKNKLAADSTFSTVVKTGDVKEFKVLDNSHNIFNYSVKINSIKYIDVITNDGNMFSEQISTQATAIYEALSGVVKDFSKLKENNDTYTDTANKTKEVANAGIDVATPNTTGKPKIIPKSAAFDSVVVEMVKSTLNSLKEDITRLINETNDIEKHSRLVYLSIFQASVAKEAFILQQYFIQENIMAKAMFDIAGDIASRKSKVANEDSKDAKRKHDDLTDKEGQLATLEGLRKNLYSNVRKVLYGE